ncbi:MAG: hypothetical protein A2138_12675 [Deltaproteobacteria bacterium RBG_16_71_12]|nr:MAG: hypothetical protein A2138_12675 [Deltaproteobacteria bacterium RBG_16_71_12]
MPEIGNRLTTGQVGAAGTTSGAQDAASIGALVLLALKSQPAGLMSVPKELLEQLATAVVELANDVVKLQGAGAVAPPAGGPRIEAQLTITSNCSQPRQREHLDGLASKIRLKCAELGIKLDVKLGVKYGMTWQLEVGGQASKAALDALRGYIGSEARGIGLTDLAKVDVNKYDLV